MKEAKTGQVEIVDTEPEVMGSVIHFIYTGRLRDLQVDKQGIEEDLLAAADKYDVRDLKAEVERRLIENMDISNVLDRYILADNYNAIKLEISARDMIIQRKKQIVRVPEWEEKLHQRKLWCRIFEAIAYERHRE